MNIPRCGCAEVVSRLLAANADLHFRDEHQACPLHEAAAKGHAAVVQQLLAARAAVGEVDCEGKEALHWAASKGHVEAAKVLLKANAQVGRAETCGNLKTRRLKDLRSRYGFCHVLPIKMEQDRGWPRKLELVHIAIWDDCSKVAQPNHVLKS